MSRSLMDVRIAVLFALVTVQLAEAAPAPPENFVVRALHEAIWDYLALDKEAPPDSQAAILGPAVDAVEQFCRLDEDERLASPLLSPHSLEMAKTPAGRSILSRLQKLRASHWYSSVVDARFVDDTLASVIVVFTPRPTEGPKPVETIDLVRLGGEWRISLDLARDAADYESTHPGALAALREATAKRAQEVAAVTTKPLDKPLDFSGVWASHFAQSGIYLAFDQTGEVFVLTTRDGSASYSIYDFHVDGDEIVIESPIYPVRFRRSERYWEQDGRRHYGLITDDARAWFPERERDGPFHLKPVYGNGHSIRRPRGQAAAD